jgi:hypothetical protein
MSRAFSSEAATGSREGNAPKQEAGAPSRSHRNGNGSNRVRFVFGGKLCRAGFVAFARDRAWRLGLELEVAAVNAEAIALAVRGEVDLIDAFEMACSLGPSDSLVLTIDRSDF